MICFDSGVCLEVCLVFGLLCAAWLILNLAFYLVFG